MVQYPLPRIAPATIPITELPIRIQSSGDLYPELILIGPKQSLIGCRQLTAKSFKFDHVFSSLGRLFILRRIAALSPICYSYNLFPFKLDWQKLYILIDGRIVIINFLKKRRNNMKSQKDINAVRLKEYNPPTNLSGSNLIEMYHEGFMNAFYGGVNASPYCPKFQSDKYEAWGKGHEDGLDATVRPK